MAYIVQQKSEIEIPALNRDDAPIDESNGTNGNALRAIVIEWYTGSEEELVKQIELVQENIIRANKNRYSLLLGLLENCKTHKQLLENEFNINGNYFLDPLRQITFSLNDYFAYVNPSTLNIAFNMAKLALYQRLATVDVKYITMDSVKESVRQIAQSRFNYLCKQKEAKALSQNEQRELENLQIRLHIKTSKSEEQ